MAETKSKTKQNYCNRIKLNGMVRGMDTPTDLISTTEARRLIDVSTVKMARLIKSGEVRTYPNPLDRREKLVSKSEVLALVPKRAEAA